MDIPLEKKLKKKAHIGIARLQDELVQMLYSIDPKLVLHGGTCIWRCYGGGRFSEDLDFYIGGRKAGEIVRELRISCKSRGLSVDKLKETQNLIFGKISGADAQVRVEINKRNFRKAAPLHYERADGSKIIVMGLKVVDLLSEKANAYLSRKLIRDIYDVYFLSGLLKEGEKMPLEVKKMLEKLPTPLDAQNLGAIVYSGAVPAFEGMASMIRGRI